MKKLTIITRVVICGAAIALGIGAMLYNPGHLISAAVIFVIGLNIEWKEKEDRYEL